MINIKDYENIVGTQSISEIYRLSEKLKDIKVTNINSTAVGGGVAEILSKMVPLLNQLGVKTSWGIIKGDQKFFSITKKIHNALHGKQESFSADEFDYFLEIGRQNMNEMKLDDDIVFIHDPQPIVLVEKKESLKNKWIWRKTTSLERFR